MGIWNMRVVREENQYTEGEFYFGVAEVFIDKNKKPWAYSSVSLDEFDSFVDLEQYLEWVNEAFCLPVLHYPADFTGVAPTGGDEDV